MQQATGGGPTFAQQPQISRHGAGGIPSQPSAAPTVNIQQPANPILQDALYKAMAQEGNTDSVTMDDVANFMLTTGRSGVRYRGANASHEFQKHFQKR